MIIDVHNHFYPKAYLDAVAKGNCVAKPGTDPESGNPLVIYEGDFNIVDLGIGMQNSIAGNCRCRN